MAFNFYKLFGIVLVFMNVNLVISSVQYCRGYSQSECSIHIECNKNDRYETKSLGGSFKCKNYLGNLKDFLEIYYHNNQYYYNSLGYSHNFREFFQSVLQTSFKYYSPYFHYHPTIDISNKDIFLNLYRETIIKLDLSSNNFVETPNFSDEVEFSNLQVLNMSENKIHQLQLYSTHSFPNLQTIDYSNNEINSIDVTSLINENIHPFSSLTNLNISRNALVTIPDGSFDKTVNIETLDLSFNKIVSLTSTSLEPLFNLRVLNLSYNLIVDCSWLSESLRNLEELNLDSNKLSNIKQENFEFLQNLRVLQLGSNNFATINFDIIKSMHLLEVISLRNNSLSKINKNDFQGQKNLKFVDLGYNKLQILNKNIFKGNNISEFHIEGNNIHGSLSKGSFDGLQFVKTLDLSKQSIGEVDDYAFYMLSNLQILNMSRNNINKLSKNCFKTLMNLLHLDLSNNRLNNIDFDKSDLFSLHFLNLRNNDILQLSNDNFEGLASLHYLVLSDNSINNIGNDTFKPLHDLEHFEMNNNPIGGNVEKKFCGFNTLTHFEISNTSLNLIKNGSFFGCHSLMFFNMSHNNLTDVEFNIFNEDTVEVMDLSFNYFQKFHINGSCLTKLKELHLNNNLLRTVDFSGLTNLNLLSISHNLFKAFEVSAFEKLKELKFLDLSFNSKLKFESTVVSNNKKLQTLNLSGLKYGDKCNNLDHLQLRNLTVSFGNITDVKKIEMSKLNFLNNLDLSNNKIIILEVDVFDNVTNLEVLDLSFNEITYIQPGTFKHNTYLSLLNISHNVVTTIGHGTFHGIANDFTLDISYNNLKILKEQMFFDAPSISTIIADSNNINKIEFGIFPEIYHHLKKLSIGDNPLPCDDVIKLQHQLPKLIITTLRHNINSENKDGITCMSSIAYDNGPVISTKDLDIHGSVISDNVIQDIKNILLSISHSPFFSKTAITQNINSESSPKASNITFSVEKNDIKLEKNMIEITKKAEDTNMLLKRMLDIMTVSAENSIKNIETSNPSNGTNNEIENVNNLKKEFELKSLLQGNRLADLENKYAHIISHLENKTHVDKKTESLANKQDINPSSGKSYFTEVCVALILIILVAAILYRLYEAGYITRSRRSVSTRPITESIESANF